MSPSSSSTFMLAAIGFAGVGAGYLGKMVARRAAVNPWRIGLVMFGLASVGHAWLSIRGGLLRTSDSFAQGQRFGELVIGPMLLPMLLLVWGARRFARRDDGTGETKGSFLGALGITCAFAFAMALGIAVVGPLLGTPEASGSTEPLVPAGTTRPAALVKIAAEAAKTLPKAVDSETEIFHISADGDALVYDYRLLKLAKAEVDTEAVVEFRSQVVRDLCGSAEARDKFLSQGVTLRHRYFDRAMVLITTVEVALAGCGAGKGS